MSEVLSRDEALKLLHKVGCPQQVIEHADTVSRIALEIAAKCRLNGVTVNRDLIEAGALLHDIGRSKTHGIQHAVVGAQVARERGLPESLVRIIENHIGAGITREETAKLGLPLKDYLQTSPEEMIVAYADKITKGRHMISFEEAVKDFASSLGSTHPAIERFRKLHKEISRMMGSEP